jgi:hypothetical protein
MGAFEGPAETREPADATTSPRPDKRIDLTAARGPFSVSVTVAVAVSTMSTDPLRSVPVPMAASVPSSLTATHVGGAGNGPLRTDPATGSTTDTVGGSLPTATTTEPPAASVRTGASSVTVRSTERSAPATARDAQAADGTETTRSPATVNV